MTCSLRNCVICGTQFSSKRKNAETCSKKCSTTLNNLKTREKVREANNVKYKDVADVPTCVICGWKSINLTGHLKTHNLTTHEYRSQYNLQHSDVFHSSYTKMKSDRMAGDKNPGFQHGGTMSSLSKKSLKYVGLTDEEAQAKINEIVSKAIETRDANCSCTSRIDYYLKRGMTQDEAAAALKKRQTTFSYDICVSKYGEEEGIKVWLARQTKWMASLDALPEEEKERIYQDKVFAIKNKYSNVSYELFESLGYPNALYGAHETSIRWKNRYIFPDFCEGHKIIEFYGDFWHGNPHKYGEDDIVTFPCLKNKRADRRVGDLWAQDAARCQYLHQRGYDILIVWERDFRADKQGTIDKCLEFLKS